MVKDGSAEFIKDHILLFQDWGRESETNDAVPHELKELGGREITFDSPFTAPMNVCRQIYLTSGQQFGLQMSSKIKMIYFEDFVLCMYHYFSLSKAMNYITIAFLSPSNVKRMRRVE